MAEEYDIFHEKVIKPLIYAKKTLFIARCFFWVAWNIFHGC